MNTLKTHFNSSLSSPAYRFTMYRGPFNEILDLSNCVKTFEEFRGQTRWDLSNLPKTSSLYTHGQSVLNLIDAADLGYPFAMHVRSVTISGKPEDVNRLCFIVSIDHLNGNIRVLPHFYREANFIDRSEIKPTQTIKLPAIDFDEMLDLSAYPKIGEGRFDLTTLSELSKISSAIEQDLAVAIPTYKVNVGSHYSEILGDPIGVTEALITISINHEKQRAHLTFKLF